MANSQPSPVTMASSSDEDPLQQTPHAHFNAETSNDASRANIRQRRRASDTNENREELATQAGADDKASKAGEGKDAGKNAARHLLEALGWTSTAPTVAWIRPTFTSWAKMKPVLRSALIAWLMMLFIVISPIERMLGNASFLVLVFAFIQPSELPLTGVIEREFFMIMIGLISWAWFCLAMVIADSVRTNRVSPASTDTATVFSGGYIETAPSIVFGFFLAFGTGGWLYLKIRFGPSPFLFASIIGCISLDISLTTGALFPYAYYTLGQVIILPIVVKSAATLVVSFFFLPKSVNSLFVDRIVLVLRPLQTMLLSMVEQFKSSPLEADFDFLKTRNIVGQSERAVPLVAGASRLLSRELTFGLASSEDLKQIENLSKNLIAPSNGYSQYFSLIENDLKSGHFPQSRSQPPTRPPSPTHGQPSHPGTPAESSHDLHEVAAGRNSSSTPERPSRMKDFLHRSHLPTHFNTKRSGSPSRSHGLFHLHLPHSSQSFHGSHTPESRPVGTWEYLRFADIEERLHRKSCNWITEQMFTTLGESSKRLMETNASALGDIVAWLEALNRQRYSMLAGRFTGRKWQPKGRPMLEVIEEVEAALAAFKSKERLSVIEPFREAVTHPGRGLHHRYLFQIWVHQHTSLVFADRLLTLLRALDKLERSRTRGEFWLPSWPKLLRLDTWQNHESSSDDADGAELHDVHDVHDDHRPGDDWYQAHLGMGGAAPRDPDALEPTNAIGRMGKSLHFTVRKFFRGNSLFFLKASALTGLLAVPFLLRSSAGWMYTNKGIWSLIMAQLTLSRHRGDSVFALVSRVMSTFFGAGIGLIIWYIGGGWEGGNPYGIMILFIPFSVALMAIRIYWPVPISAIIGTVTVSLVVGYSWKDSYNPTYGTPGTGWDVAWRRFLEVIIGSTAAVLWSFLPPSSTLREYLRESHASSIHRTGIMHCRLLALTSDRGEGEVDPSKLTGDLIAQRQKLRRLAVLSTNTSYELSPRGRWPKERYQVLFEVELALSKLLSAAVIIVDRLGPAYSRALLRRTKFANEDFTADVGFARESEDEFH